MDYFLQTETSQFHFWQLELIIESFKYNECEDDLFVSASSSPDQIDPSFLKNISSHKRKEHIYNYGQDKGYRGINKIYNLLNALYNERIKQPVCVVELDSVFRKKVSIPEEQGLYPNLVFSIDPSFTIEESEARLGDFCTWLELDREKVKQNWIPLGGCYVFNKIPIGFFTDVLKDVETLVIHQELDNKLVWDKTCDLAVALNFSKNIPYIACRGDYYISTPMDAGSDSFFVSYKNGFIPTFHKSMFTFTPPYSLSLGDPIKALSKLSFSPNAEYISKVARRIIERQ